MLIPVTEAKLGPVSASAGGPITVRTDSSLRDALDSLVLCGLPSLTVVDPENRPVGSISVDQISAALGADVSPVAAPSAPGAAARS